MNANLRTKGLYIILLLYGPCDAVARVSRSSMVALHTFLTCVMHVAFCRLFCNMQFFAALSYHVGPSFLLNYYYNYIHA